MRVPAGIKLVTVTLTVVTAWGCSSPSSQPQSASSSTQPNPPSTTARAAAQCAHRFGLYVGTDVAAAEAGQSADDANLVYARDAGFDTVIGYDLFQATPTAVKHYLDTAQAMDLKVLVNLQEWGKVDDPAVQEFYETHYGKPPVDWAYNIVQKFGAHPAVHGFNLTDEYPADPSTKGIWQQELQARLKVIRAHSNKPVMLTLYWADFPRSERHAFYQKVLTAGTDLALDYYPFPEQPKYGPVSNIDTIGRDLATVNPGKGWYVAQAFAWGGESNRKTGASLGFADDAPAPATAQMVDMASRALKGGAQHILFYSLFDLDNPQKRALKAAIQKLRKQFC